MIDNKSFKLPISVLVIIYNDQQQILLIERADRPGFWQSITGSLELGETLLQTAIREVAEETGIIIDVSAINDWHQSTVFEIYTHWRHRYAPSVTHNTEHIFSLCVSTGIDINLAPKEHLHYGWFSRQEAMAKVFSPSNREALIQLPHHW